MRHISLFFILFPLFSFSQWMGDVKTTPEYVSDWRVDKPSSYQGEYHFGMSGGESYLRVIVSRDQIYVQRCMGEFTGDDEGNVDFRWIYENMQPAVIQGNKIVMGAFKGKFVSVQDPQFEETILGIQMEHGWSINIDEEAEIGMYRTDLLDVYAGRFPRASIEILSQADLRTYTKEALQIMRNEIFARYGYTFRKGGKMEAYFQSQKWYIPQHKNVDAFLTVIEKENIKTIQTMERR